ncbi:MAG: cytochrome c [Ignavibacteriales bacterium]|nr:cytochrome c [Ignavibacteriales bacterium]
MSLYKKPEDELKFRELLKSPIRLFGWVFPLFFVIILLFGIYFVTNLNQISFNEQAVGFTDTTNVKKEIELKKGSISVAVDLKLIKNPTPDYIANGKKLYEATCMACHGSKGLGDGTAGAMLNPKPRNLISTEGWTNGRNIDQMYKTLHEGIIKNGMAAYEYLPAADRLAIISYIRNFTQFPLVTDEQVTSLDQTYKLSKGTVLPNQVPVRIAEIKLINDSSTSNEQLLKFENKIYQSQGNAGADILKKNSLNYKKVFTSFSRLGTNQSLDKYISVVIANPINSGFSPAVVQLSKEEWKMLYDYLKTATM